MRHVLLWIVQIGIVLHLAAALAALGGVFGKRKALQNSGLFILALLGPIVLWLCWWNQLLFREQDAVFWGRLMAGDVAGVFRIGSVGLIVGSGLALGALSLVQRISILLYPSALIFASVWFIIYLHPTPHYVPIPEWLDKLVWFGCVIGGAAAALAVYHRLQDRFGGMDKPGAVAAALVSTLSLASLLAQDQALRPIDLAPLSAEARIKDMGCLSCHSIGNVGYPIPGGGLESVASRTEDVVLAFMKNPDAETAKELGIRTEPTGEMAGVRLTDEEARLLTEAMKELFEILPPSALGPGWENVERILEQNTCLACHSVYQDGAPGGGIGGPIEKAAILDKDVLTRWLIEPTLEMARELGISENPMGAMTAFALPEEEALEVAEWILTLNPEWTPDE